MGFDITGMPENLPKTEDALFQSRISVAYEDLKKHCKSDLGDLHVSFGRPVPEGKDSGKKQPAAEEVLPGSTLPAVEPKYQFEQLILPDATLHEIKHKISLFQLKNKVFEEWGLKKIEPYPRSALNFYGPPGTGKTMAAHAIAQFLGKKIILATYAEIESKYHGDGPKNVKALFRKAEEADALLFIDEADSLLSQRLSNVTQGSEQAINSMRSQLLICLEKFSGLVIFSTNFVEQYDKAFETRVSNIEFKMPDAKMREKIWKQHLPESLPLQADVNVSALAEEIGDICGRDIKNAVIDAALKVAYAQAHEGRTASIGMADLKDSILLIKKNRIKKESKNIEVTVSEKEKKKYEKILRKKFASDKRGKKK